ncbi:dynamin family protein [Sanguibacter sp. A247]|uniref:dynamin family protein n=1 Tax=unclassified Sanguibacter TaxID=2645534 RepID=UPI003FD7ADA0
MTLDELTPEHVPDATLLDVVVGLRREVVDASFVLDTPGTRQARTLKRTILERLDDHLLPRLRELSRPAVVVVAGSTGAGKSTIVNSLLGDEVSKASVLRPTTREPVLVTHPDDAELAARLDVGVALRVEHERVPRGIALLDAPDLDSLMSSNRETAVRLLAAADLGLFVTTAARYGDALPWQVLADAKERGASVAMVLNRVSDVKVGEVRTDLVARLREHGLASSALFVVRDEGAHEGMLPTASVAPIARWLRTVAGADQARTVIVRTLRGALDALVDQVGALVEAVEDQADAAVALRAAVADAVPSGLGDLAEATVDGTLSTGAVEAAWLAAIDAEPGIVRPVAGRFRRPRQAALARRAAALEVVTTRVRETLVTQVLAAARTSSETIGERLGEQSDRLAGGAALFDAVQSDGELAQWRDEMVRSEVDAWLGGVADAVAMLEPAVLRAADRGLTREGLVAVATAASVGVAGAERVLAGVAGSAAGDLVDAARANVVAVGRKIVEDEAGPYVERLDVPGLAREAVTGLRLRLAELRRQVRAR